MDVYYEMVSGHLKKNESLKQTIIRDAFEEVGILIKEEELKIVCEIRRDG